MNRFLLQGLSLLFIGLSLTAVYYYLRLPLLSLEKVEVSLEAGGKASLSPLDQALLARREFLAENRSLLKNMEHPAERTRFNGFWIDRCEVSQGDYGRFAAWANREELNLAEPFSPEGWKFETEAENHLIFGREEAPANAVAFYDALAYCVSAGGRLPSDGEWNAAAAGKSGRLYPWGDEFAREAWSLSDPALDAARSCGSLEEMNTPEGLNGMGSNVSEWTLGEFPEGNPTASGGNGAAKKPDVTSFSFYREEVEPGRRSNHVGFRCVYERKPQANPWDGKIDPAFVEEGVYPTGTPPNTLAIELIRALDDSEIEKLPLLLNGPETESEGLIRVTKHEITVELYQSFLNDPFARLGLYANPDQPDSVNYRPEDWEYQKENLDHPVRGIDWWSAAAFANWAGGSLPTEDQWIALYRISAEGEYLNGDEFVPDSALGREVGWGEPLPVGAMPQDQTSAGIFDLMGNVSEWTQSVVIRGEGYGMVVKGGSYLIPGEEAASANYRRIMRPRSFSHDVGLRLVFN